MRNHFLLFLCLVGCVTGRKPYEIGPLPDGVIYPTHFLPLSQASSPTAAQKSRAQQIQHVLRAQIIPDSPLTVVQLAKMVAFMDFVRSHYVFTESIYVTPDDQRVFFPLQFYPNGHIYLHTEGDDPSQRSGTFKVFSRSIAYPEMQVYANLELKREKHKALGEVKREIAILQAIEGVVGVPHLRDYGMYRGKTAGMKRFAIQMELFTEDISERKMVLEDGPQIVKLAAKVVHTVRALHEKAQYIHRDLKPKNFFWKKENGQERVVVADFGLAEREGEPRMGQQLVGTRAYLAPELSFRRVREEPVCQTFAWCKKADIFAVGMTLLDLLGEEKEVHLKKMVYALHGPFLPTEVPTTKMLHRIRAYARLHKAYYVHGRPEYAAHPQEAVLHAFRQLIWQMIHPDPVRRPNLDKVEDTLREIQEKYKSSMGRM